MKKILITRNVPESSLTELRKEFEITVPEDVFSADELKKMIPDYEAIHAVSTPIPRELIELGTKLEAIGNNGVGYDNIDWQYATERGIAVINTPVNVMEPTSELAIALMLAITRGVVMFDRDLRETKVCPKTIFFDRDMCCFGKTLGVVGFGRIGKATAKKAKALGMDIIYYDEFRASPEVEAEIGARYMSFDEVLHNADVVTSHCPYLESTHHMFNKEAFAKMKDGAYLVNCTRGAIVCEADLVDALKSGKLRGAGLDVFEFEPKVGDELANLPNVVITPHVGTNTTEVRLKMLAEALNGVATYLRGERPANLANPSILG